MSRRPAKNTQADIARAVRAAKQTGADRVEVRPDGTIAVMLIPHSGEQFNAPFAPSKELVY